MDDLCSNALDTSFTQTFNKDDERGSTSEDSLETESNDESSDENEKKGADEENESKRPTEEEDEENAKKKKIVTKSYQKRSLPRSQIQALGQIASSVNKLADVNAKRLKVEERDRDTLLRFRKKRKKNLKT